MGLVNSCTNYCCGDGGKNGGNADVNGEIQTTVKPRSDPKDF